MGLGDFWALTGQSWGAPGHTCPRPEQTLGLQKDVAPAEGAAFPQIKTRTGAIGTQSRPPKPTDRSLCLVPFLGPHSCRVTGKPLWVQLN